LVVRTVFNRIDTFIWQLWDRKSWGRERGCDMQQRTRLWTMVGCTYTHLTSLCHGHPALALCPILATPQKMSDTPLPGTIYLNQPGPGLYLNQRPVTIYLNQSGPGLYSIREFKTHLLTPFYLFLLINIFCNKNLFFVYRLSNSVHKGMKHGWPEEQTDAGCGESALMSRNTGINWWTASWRHTHTHTHTHTHETAEWTYCILGQ